VVKAKGVVPIAIGLSILYGCASPPAAQHHSSQVSPRVAGATLDYDHPLGLGATKVNSSDEARRYLSFDPLLANNLGDPRDILVETWKGDTGEDTRLHQFALIYVTYEYGKVVVIERPAQQTASEFAAFAARLVARSQEPQVQGHAEVVATRGSQALITVAESQDLATIDWIEKGVQFEVLGPSLTRNQVVQIADNY
jgi:hypothetical protein